MLEIIPKNEKIKVGDIVIFKGNGNDAIGVVFEGGDESITVVPFDGPEGYPHLGMDIVLNTRFVTKIERKNLLTRITY